MSCYVLALKLREKVDIVMSITKPCTLIAAVLLVLVTSAAAFDPPSCGDPWYYQSNNRGLAFMVPDKAQHYWGTRALAEVAKLRMSGVAAATLALAAGFMWEVKDNYTPLGAGGLVGFSWRDFVADILGAGGTLLDNETVTTWVQWSTKEKTITLNISVRW